MDSAIMVEMKSDESSQKSKKMSYQEAPLPPPPSSVSLFEKINKKSFAREQRIFLILNFNRQIFVNTFFKYGFNLFIIQGQTN